MSSFQESRHPRHRDGRFATAGRKEPDVELAAPVRISWKDQMHWGPWIDDEDTEEGESSETRTGTGSAMFDERARLVLGVPAGTPVTVEEENGSRGDYTREEWESATITAGSASRTFGSLPALFRELDWADRRRRYTAEDLLADLQRVGRVTIPDDHGSGVRQFHARIGNARGRQVLLVVAADGSWGARGSYTPAGTQESWIHLDVDRIWRWEVTDCLSCSTCGVDVEVAAEAFEGKLLCEGCRAAVLARRTCQGCGHVGRDVGPVMNAPEIGPVCRACREKVVCEGCGTPVPGHRPWCTALRDADG